MGGDAVGSEEVSPGVAEGLEEVMGGVVVGSVGVSLGVTGGSGWWSCRKLIGSVMRSCCLF